MAKPNKLNIIWASAGVSVDPTDAKFQLGWEAEIPPYQYFNYVLNKTSRMLDHINTHGIPEWDSSTSYVIGAKVLYNGITYTCIVANSGSVPGVSGNWYNKEGDITKIPIGTIMMFDANTPTTIDGVTVLSGKGGAWVDNTTIPGWYACVNGNQSKGCPNLVNKFIMGKVVAGAGVWGGNNSPIISLAQLPAHTHTHTIGNEDTPHTHSVTGGNHRHSAQAGGGGGLSFAINATSSNSVLYVNYDGGHTHTVGNSSASHSHNLTIDSTPAAVAFDNRPAFYALIYIRKCS